MNTAPTFAKTLTLRGRISAEIIPSKKWRELAAKGVKSMSYRISGDAEVDGQLLHVNVHVPAVHEGHICGLGAAIPTGGTAAVEFVQALSPKNGGLDTAKVAVGPDGTTVIGEDGLPVYIEGQDIPEGFETFGTHYFCPTHSGLTLRVTDVQLSPSERLAPDGTPYYEARGLGHEVIPAQIDRANGAPLVRFTPAKQAARKTQAAVAAPAPQVAELRM